VPMPVRARFCPGRDLAKLLRQKAAEARREAAEAHKKVRHSREAKHRLKLIRWHEAHHGNVARTAERFGYDRVTMHAWPERHRSAGRRWPRGPRSQATPLP